MSNKLITNTPKLEIYAKLIHPEYGYDSEVNDAKQLQIGNKYEIDRVAMGLFHTSVTLKGIKGCFSSVQFEFFDTDDKEVDIYTMPEFNHYYDIFATGPAPNELKKGIKVV